MLVNSVTQDHPVCLKVSTHYLVQWCCKKELISFSFLNALLTIAGQICYLWKTSLSINLLHRKMLLNIPHYMIEIILPFSSFLDRLVLGELSPFWAPLVFATTNMKGQIWDITITSREHIFFNSLIFSLWCKLSWACISIFFCIILAWQYSPILI